MSDTLNKQSNVRDVNNQENENSQFYKVNGILYRKISNLTMVERADSLNKRLLNQYSKKQASFPISIESRPEPPQSKIQTNQEDQLYSEVTLDDTPDNIPD